MPGCVSAAARGLPAQPLALRRIARQLGGSALSATVRPSRSSVARYTRPMPPRPTSRTIVYGPTRCALGRAPIVVEADAATRSATGALRNEPAARVMSQQRRPPRPRPRIVVCCRARATHEIRGSRVERLLEQIADASATGLVSSLPLAQLAKQPGARQRPSALQRRRRHSSALRFPRCSGRRNSAARRCAPARGRSARAASAPRRAPAASHPRWRRRPAIVQRHAVHARPALLRAARPRAIDENLAHRRAPRCR